MAKEKKPKRLVLDDRDLQIDWQAEIAKQEEDEQEKAAE